MSETKVYLLAAALTCSFVNMQSTTNHKIINTDPCAYIPVSKNRTPKGIWKSPYALGALPRYTLNFISNGYFSYKNPDFPPMHPLSHLTTTMISTGNQKETSIKIIFIGDIMVSKSGKFPQLDTDVIALLKSADVIIANVESPVVQGKQTTGRSWLSLRFEMPIYYLQELYNYNPRAKWILSIANNHALDTSSKDSEDISGLVNTIAVIKEHMPDAAIVGAEVAGARSVTCLQLNNGFRIGIVAWTDIMNLDSTHFRKPVVRGEDIEPHLIEQIKKDAQLNFLIGLPHGNEEQSYEPLKKTRDHWVSLSDPRMFNIIVGTGPHVVQAAEEKNKCLIFHSIGNFVSSAGGAQTKIGCIPEIDLKTSSDQVVQFKHKVNFLQQHKNSISLLDLDHPKTPYPKTVSRLKKIWRPDVN